MKILTRFLAALALVALAAFQPAEAQTFNTYRNLLINGEALIANTGGTTLTGINTTPTYGADGWAGFSNNGSASMVVGRSTANLPTGFQQAFSFQRTASNSNLTQICGVQEVETARVKAVAGQNLVFSFYGAVAATFTGAGSNAQVTAIWGTGSDEGLATLLSGWAGATTVVNNTLVPLTTAYSRNGVTFALPSAATELAVEVCWTPVGTASSTTDALFITGTQLEVLAGNCPAVPGSAGYAAQVAAVCASAYEHLAIDQEIPRTSRLFQQFNEVNTVMYPCIVTASNVQNCIVPLPVQMRIAPTVTVAAGGFQMIIDGAAGTAITTMAGGVSTPFVAVVTAANTTTVAAHGIALRGSLTTGTINASARF